jgi:hypothetical protein
MLEDDDGGRLLCGLSYLVRLAKVSRGMRRKSESMGEKRRRRGHYRHRGIGRRRGRKTLYGSRAVYQYILIERG